MDLRELTGELRSSLTNNYPDLESVIDKDAQTASKTLTETTGLKISGFVDASYFYDASCGDNTFGLDQMEIDLDKSIGNVGSIRADLEWVNAGTDSFALKAEQGYVTFNPSFLKSVNFTFGKFNAPIGFELLDAPDMYQFSHALVFDNGLPTNLSGAMFSSNLTPNIDVAAYICNGWDLNIDNNTGKTFGGRFGYSMGDYGGFGVSAIRGAEAGPEGDFLTIFDIDVTYTPTGTLTFGGEVNTGSDAVGDTTKKWMGFMLMSHYDFTDKLGLTFRYDFFYDKDGARLGSDVIERRQAITICPTFSLGKGMGALIEFRYDMSDKKVFVAKANKPVKSMFGIAFEMTYSF